MPPARSLPVQAWNTRARGWRGLEHPGFLGGGCQGPTHLGNEVSKEKAPKGKKLWLQGSGLGGAF